MNSNSSTVLSVEEPFILSIGYDPNLGSVMAMINDGGVGPALAEMELPISGDSVDVHFEVRGTNGASLVFAGAVHENYEHAVPVDRGIVYKCADPEHKFSHNWYVELTDNLF